MKQSIDFSSIQTALANFLKRFHGVIFFAGLGLALAAALFLIVGALTTTSTSQNDIQAESSQFDEDTIKKLQDDQAASDNDSTTLPSGRRDPFVE